MTTAAPPPVIPCGTCLHKPICYLRREIPDDPAQLAEPMIMGPGLRLVTTGVRLECDHHLEAVATSTSGRTIAIREPAAAPRHQSKAQEARDKAQRAAAVMAALERHAGDRRAAAAELGMKLNALSMVAKHAAGRVPEVAS